MTWRHHYELPAGLRVISVVPGPIMAIETLRAQCELVPIDADTDAASGVTHPDDALLLGYLDAAIDYAEDFTGLSILQRVYEMALDCFPRHYHPSYSNGIAILRPPLVGIDSFIYAEGSDGELDEGDHYVVDLYRTPPMVLPVLTWPVMIHSTNAIKIRYRAGYFNGVSDDSDFTEAPPLPSGIKQALLLMVYHFWKNRSDTVEQALATIPTGARDLLGFKRVRLGMA